ncbi:Oxygen-dependent choline dehydrogenase [compost metagenome]
MKGKLLFDYIVVGSGPAGAVIAKTLTDDKKTSVLLIEAGENRDQDQPIMDSTFAPELEALLLMGSSMYVQPQPCLESGNSYSVPCGHLIKPFGGLNDWRIIMGTPTILLRAGFMEELISGKHLRFQQLWLKN